MKRIITCVAIGLMTASTIWANETVSLTIGEWAPFTSEKDVKGQVAQTIVNESFKLENIDVEYSFQSWKESYDLALIAKSEGSFPWNKTKERAESFLYSKHAIIRAKTVFFHLKGNGFSWNNYEDLKKYKISEVEGYKSSKVLADAGVNISVVKTEKENMKKLLLGEIDATSNSILVGYNLINKSFSSNDASRFTHNKKLLFPETGSYFILSKQHPKAKELMEKFNKGFLKLLKSGRYTKIIKESLKK